VRVRKDKLILAINPGSTSTKIAVYNNDKQIYIKEINHTLRDLAKYASIMDQLDFRKFNILNLLKNTGFSLDDFTCIVGRGGRLKPIPAGTYLVNDTMLRELKKNSEHASSLGAFLAKDIADRIGVRSYVVDPISVDEMEEVARISGMPGIERESIFHALNQKAVARRAAAVLKKTYNKANLIVAHLGGGISVGIHRKGKVVDVNNALCGDGPFAPTRSGGLPVWACIEYARSGKHTLGDLKKNIMNQGGVVSYLGTDDMKIVKEMVKQGNRKARIVYEAMAYQIAKEIGAGAAVLSGKVDAIVFTGGLARDKEFIDLIRKKIKFIARVMVYPGNNEMNALVQGVLRVLYCKEKAKEYI
jgi:butyrate kinase